MGKRGSVFISKTEEWCCLLAYVYTVNISILSIKPCHIPVSNRTLVRTEQKFWPQKVPLLSSGEETGKQKQTVHIFSTKTSLPFMWALAAKKRFKNKQASKKEILMCLQKSPPKGMGSLEQGLKVLVEFSNKPANGPA